MTEASGERPTGEGSARYRAGRIERAGPHERGSPADRVRAVSHGRRGARAVRAVEVQRQLLDFQDRQLARSSQMTLAEEHNPARMGRADPRLPARRHDLVPAARHHDGAQRLHQQGRVQRRARGAGHGVHDRRCVYFGSSLGSSKKDAAIQSGRLTTNTEHRIRRHRTRDPEATSAGPPPPQTPAGPAKQIMTRSTPRRTSWFPPSGIYGLFRQKAPVIMRRSHARSQRFRGSGGGMLGNIGWECGGFKALQEVNPRMGGRSAALAGANGPRPEDPFENWLKDNGWGDNYQDDAANYGYLLYELRGPQKPCPTPSGDARTSSTRQRIHAILREAATRICGISTIVLGSRGLRFRNTGGRSMSNESNHKQRHSRYFMAPLWISLGIFGIALAFLLGGSLVTDEWAKQDKATLAPYKPGGLFAEPGASEPTATARGDGAGGAPGTGETSPLKPASVSDLVWKSPASALEWAAEGVKHDRIEFAIYRHLLRAALGGTGSQARRDGVSTAFAMSCSMAALSPTISRPTQRHGATGFHDHDDDQAGVAAGDALEKELQTSG